MRAARRALPSLRSGADPRTTNSSDGLSSGQNRTLHKSRRRTRIAWAMLPILVQHLPRDRDRMGLRQVQMAGRLRLTMTEYQALEAGELHIDYDLYERIVDLCGWPKDRVTSMQGLGRASTTVGDQVRLGGGIDIMPDPTDARRDTRWLSRRCHQGVGRGSSGCDGDITPRRTNTAAAANITNNQVKIRDTIKR